MWHHSEGSYTPNWYKICLLLFSLKMMLRFRHRSMISIDLFLQNGFGFD